MSKIFKIVLTGGPCGGKTSAIPILKKFLQDKGWKVYTTPEVATLASDNGVNLGDPGSEDKFFAFVNLMMALEGTMEAWAKESGKDCVILSDRGIMDSKAYTPPDKWPQYLANRKFSEPELREGRYDAVFHLVSAAVGAPAFYNHDNPARWETLEQAAPADRRTQEAWVGHPHLRIIDNSTDFPNKIARLCSAVEHFLDPNRKEIERRFLIENDSLFDLNKELLHPVTLDITQTYLKTTDGTVTRIRRRGDDLGAIYTFTAKSPKIGASCMEVEHNISSAEFAELIKQYDPDRRTIQKKRHCFLWHDKQFELDEFVSPRSGMRILEIELDREDEPFVFPAFLTSVKEITTDPEYSNWNIAYGRNDAVEAHQ
jgi:CYTH domain-containing protein/predicted ATPase